MLSLPKQRCALKVIQFFYQLGLMHDMPWSLGYQDNDVDAKALADNPELMRMLMDLAKNQHL